MNIKLKQIILIISLLMVCLSAFSNIFTSVEVSDLGAQTHALEIKLNSIKNTNISLQGQLARSQSLAKIKEEAVILGYIPRQDISLVSAANPVASLIR